MSNWEVLSLIVDVGLLLMGMWHTVKFFALRKSKDTHAMTYHGLAAVLFFVVGYA